MTPRSKNTTTLCLILAFALLFLESLVEESVASSSPTKTLKHAYVTGPGNVTICGTPGDSPDISGACFSLDKNLSYLDISITDMTGTPIGFGWQVTQPNSPVGVGSFGCSQERVPMRRGLTQLVIKLGGLYEQACSNVGLPTLGTITIVEHFVVLNRARNKHAVRR